MENSSNSNVGCNEENVLVTPYQKQMLLKSELQSLGIDLPPSSDGDNSSVASMNEGCESPLSSWVLEPETDIQSLEGINLEEKYLDMEEQNQFVGVESSDDGLLWEMDNRSYDDLLKKFMEKEDELRFSNFRLQHLEQENINLKVLVETVSKESKLKEEELHKQKELSEEEVFNLMMQIEKSENQLDNVQEELNLKQEKLRKLKSEMRDSQTKFCLQKHGLHVDISNLSKMKIELTSKLEDCESRNKELENKLRQYEAEKLKEEELHATKQKFLQVEIMSLTDVLENKMLGM